MSSFGVVRNPADPFGFGTTSRTPGPLTRQRVSRRQAQRRFAHWIEKAAITRAASPHSLRHRFAMAMYARTQDVLLVKEALHHRSITSTLVYARADETRLRRALGCFARSGLSQLTVDFS